MHETSAESSSVCVEALAPIQCQKLRDVRWALQSSEVLAKYMGEYVVPYRQQVVAHGDEELAVLAAAARVTGLDPDELPVVAITNPLEDIWSA